MPKKVTMTEIAKKCGVSQTLVSFALSGNNNSVGEKTREKILSCAREMGYKPLHTATAYAIGFVCDAEFEALPIIPLMCGLRRELIASGTELLFCGSTDNIRSDGINEQGNISGLIVATEKSEVLKELLNLTSVPFCAVRAATSADVAAKVAADEILSLVKYGKTLTEKEISELELPGKRAKRNDNIWLL